MDASSERDQKLAAARKKLKKFKSQKAGNKNADASSHISNGGTSPPYGVDSGAADSSAVESLLQLSSQLNGLLDEGTSASNRSLTNGTTSPTPSHNVQSSIKGRKSPIGGANTALTSDESLMERNRELAGRVRDLQQKNTQLNRQMQIQSEHLTEMEKQLNTSQSEATEKTRLELQQTREQLQVHIQTIGILVEEKQTLQKQLSSANKNSQQKSDELEDSLSRLKASRLRVSDLEKQLAMSNTQKARAESASGDNSKLVQKLKTDLYTKTRDLDEVLEQRSELEKQLQGKLTQNAHLEATITDYKSKLELSQAYIQQLSQGGDATTTQPDLYTQQIQELQAQNSRLHEKAAQLEESFHTAAAEKMQSAEQYTQIISSLQSDQHKLHSDLDASHHEMNRLQTLLDEQKDHNARLSQHLENLQTKHAEAEATPATDVPPQTENMYTAAQVQELVNQYEHLRLQAQAYAKNCEVLTSNNQQLSRLLEEKDETMSELESTLERIQDEKDNSKKLLETVEGDKSALSRALSQNRQLKTQLEELESRFIKITEDHMNTMTSLQREQHVNKELSAKLAELDDKLSTVSNELEQKNRYISEHEDKLEAVSKMSHQQEQLADRIRHYEAKIQMMSALQRELHSSQETVRALTDQNAQLRHIVVNQGTSRQNSTSIEPPESPPTDGVEATEEQVAEQQTQMEPSEVVTQLRLALDQLEKERDSLVSRVEDLMSENNRLSHQLMLQSEPSLSDPHQTTPEQYDAIKHALDSLQDKYTVVMRTRAELTDRCEILEHENMQLQAESETINEYIQLYHHQRSIMKQRADDKDRVIQRLAGEREKISVKMAELQSLVVKLLQERQLLQSYNSQPSTHQYSTYSQHPHTSISTAEDYSQQLSQTDDQSEHSDGNLSPTLNQSVESSLSQMTAETDISMDTTSELTNHSPHSNTLPDLSKDFIDGTERVPGVTAQRIMTLLSEIGNANKVSRQRDISHILHCSHCSGPVVSM